MKKCICFSRVSSYHQDLQAQKVAVMTAARKEYKASEIIEVSGKESAIKLKEEERQTLNELKSIVEENPSIESIYFFAVDRLARRVSVVQSIKEFADERKINLVFLNPYPFSTWFRNTDGEWKKNEISDLYLMFLAYGAKMEMEIKNERFSAAKKLMRERNEVTGTLAFGYCKDENKHITINKDEAKIVKWVFDCYLHKDMSTNQIFDEGYELGYWEDLKQRANKAGKIRRILNNYAYAGKPLESGMEYPPIVDVEDVDAAIKLMDERKRKPNKIYQDNIYYAKGIIREETSNTAMTVDIYHLRYYAPNAENKISLNVNVADYLVWRTAFECKWNLMTVNDVDSQIEATKEKLKEVSQKTANLINERDNEIKPKYKKAYDSYINSRGRITQEMYYDTLDGIEKAEKALNKKIEALNKRETELYALIDELNNKKAVDLSIYTLKDIKDDNQRMEIIKECVIGMTVNKIGNIYHIKVDHKMFTSPNEYIYIPHGGSKTELYLMVGKFTLEDFDAATRLRNMEILDISDELEIRYKKGGRK